MSLSDKSFLFYLGKLGPNDDHDGMRIFYFMDIWAQDGQPDEAGAWLQSPLIDGKEHPFGCFSFWFTFKVSLYSIVLALLNMFNSV